MTIALTYQKKVLLLKEQFLRLKKGQDQLFSMIDEVEISEAVYNSNAIENSTLTLKETEKILLELEISRNVSLREVYEAKNLARVIEYIKTKKENVNRELILLLHKMLITNINDSIAGRFRGIGEHVRVGTHIAPAPEKVELLIEAMLDQYQSDQTKFTIEKIAKFHLEFERIHPFNDGNGRIGRVLVNYLLLNDNFPPITIFNKDKQTYYLGFREYDEDKSSSIMEAILVKQVLESLHKRLAYLSGEEIINLTQYAKANNLSVHSLLNAARRQTIPAFREKGRWKIARKS
jgi:Fic family protein